MKESRTRRVRKVRKKAKTGLFRIIFSRTALIAVLLLVQIGILALGLVYVREYRVVLYAFLQILGIVVTIAIINGKDNPAFKLTWILVVLALPVFGTAMYIWCRIQPGTHGLALRLQKLKEETDEYMEQDPRVFADLRRSKLATANLAYYMANQLHFPTYRNTEMMFFPLGQDKFAQLKEELNRAESFIFMEYFIVEESYMWSEILKILKHKARAGVEVRFMYDGIGSLPMPHNYPEKLKKYGIKCKIFNPIRPVLSTVQNNRDHRKICVIDGKVAFTGGINLGDEYINRKRRFGHWKDTAIMLKGNAVQSFTMMFLNMWNIDERAKERYERYLTPMSSVVLDSLGYALPYADSPYDHENVGEQVYFHILNHAKKYVHIMTPYLILDNEMITTLMQTAKSGIDVKIIMPYIPDKWYAFALAKTYYEELMEAGVEIYEYIPGFVHAKIFVSDDDTATVGTVNLDFRSLYLHHECGVFIYNNPVVADIEEDFQNTLERCRRVTFVQLRQRSLLMKMAGPVLRLFAPLL
jgi:cardiolipin synthase